VSVQDRCMVCAKCTIGLETFWTHLMVPLGDEDLVDAHFVCLETVLLSVQDRYKVCAKRTTGSEIVMDAPDGTPR
jgi:hypothetical protein